MTIAVADWLCEDKTSNNVLIEKLQYWGNLYPNHGYGGMFLNWLKEDNPKPYGSWANGSAMRVSPCGWVGENLKEVRQLAEMSASVIHNHPEGINGALAVAEAIYFARMGASKSDIKNDIERIYGYDLSRDIDDIRDYYEFDVSCAGSVPESIICFLQADDYEDCIRNAISLGGDADTQAAIGGSIAAAYWDVPQSICNQGIDCLDSPLFEVFKEFNQKYEGK